MSASPTTTAMKPASLPSLFDGVPLWLVLAEIVLLVIISIEGMKVEAAVGIRQSEFWQSRDVTVRRISVVVEGAENRGSFITGG